MSDLVVDASALLAILNQEPASERWAPALRSAAISTANLSEVVARLMDAAMPEDEIRMSLDLLGLEVVLFDAAQAYQAGRFRLQTKDAGLSLGDRACLALAHALKLPVLTADRAWKSLRLGLEIRLLR